MTDTDLILSRIADALEQIASSLKPSGDRDDRNFHDLLTDIDERLCKDSSDGALEGIHACLADISDAVNGGRSVPETTIVDSLETIATVARTQV